MSSHHFRTGSLQRVAPLLLQVLASGDLPYFVQTAILVAHLSVVDPPPPTKQQLKQLDIR
jgi:hypothetical protein